MENNFVDRNGASYGANYIEYLVAMRNTPSLLLKKSGIIFAAAALILAGSVFILRYVPALFVVYTFLIIIGAWYLWRFVSIEFEYIIASGEMDVDIIYGQRQRKRLASAKIKDMEIIAPAEEKYAHRYNASDINRKIFAAAATNAPDTYFCVYTDQKRRKTLLYFAATKKTVEIMRFYNSSATVVSDRLPY